MSTWNAAKSEELYNVPAWGCGFFDVGPSGHLRVWPEGEGGPDVDLYELTQTVQRRGVATPLLLRFTGILRARVRQVSQAFENARAEFEYTSPYRGVFPLKVNQERWVVEGLLEEGREYGMGLEVGSKPELIAGIALQAGEQALLICNGYKDTEYVEMALLSARLGITSVIVIEKLTELETVLRTARVLGMRPRIGVRCKLSLRSSGRWSDSTGARSKFGLTASEIVTLVETLRENDLLDCLELLHVHIGSQITHIRSVKTAMREASQVLANLHEMGAPIRWFDAGGGLAVDYDGSGSTGDSSMNYSLQEYANDIVWALAETCRERGIKQPTILTESGRALVAHHSVLVTEVVGTSGVDNGTPIQDVGPEDHDLIVEFAELTDDLSVDNYVERYHDAQELRERALALFNSGHFSLADKGRAEQMYGRTCLAVNAIALKQEFRPDALADLERDLADTYFLNASIFQSLPDFWAVGQLFPIMPLHRLDEEPTERAVLADLTCDSDGRIDRFITPRGQKTELEVHRPSGDQPYYLGVFLLGAYQEILGDIHNLFGDTHVVHVDADPQGRPRLVHVQRGDSVKEVLSYVQYDEEELLRSVRRHVEQALGEGRMSDEDSALFLARYEAGLRGYTYLTRQATGAGSFPSPSVTPPPATHPLTQGDTSENQERVHG